MKKFLAALLSISLMLSLLMIPASAAPVPMPIEKNGYDFTRISNPGADADINDGHIIDGLIPDGDRMQSYAWAVAERDGYIYIGTNYNFLGQQIKAIIGSSGGGSSQTILDIIQEWTQDQLPAAGSGSNAPVLLKINPKSGDVKKLDPPNSLSDPNAAYRSAIVHDDIIYMGTWGPGAAGIIKIYENDNVEFSKAPQSSPIPGITSSMRACAIYDGELYFAGIDFHQTGVNTASILRQGTSPYALIKLTDAKASGEDDWEIVAGYESFKDYAKNDLYYLIGGGSFWDIIEYNGFIYAIIATSTGFVLLKAAPDGNGKITGWQTVIGDEAGASRPRGGENYISGENDTLNTAYVDLLGSPAGNAGFLAFTATPYVYDGKLYIGTFDNAPYAMVQGFCYPLADVINFLRTGKSTTQRPAKLSDMTRALEATLDSPQHLYMIDENDTIKDVTPKSVTRNPTIEYIWRMIDFENELYMSTFDAATLYQYVLAPSLRPSELLGAYAYGDKYADRADAFFNRLYVVRDNLGRLASLLDSTPYENTAQTLFEQASNLIDFLSVLFDYRGNNAVPFSVSSDETLDENEKILNALVKIDDATKNLEDTKTIEILDGIAGDIKNLPSQLVNAAEVDAIDDEVTEENNFDAFLALISGSQNEAVSAQGTAALAAPSLRDIADILVAAASFLRDFVDLEGLAAYNEVAGKLRASNPGFELFVSSDGEQFNRILSDGIDDSFNYGGRTFVISDKKLYLGTANPFYGAQLWHVDKRGPVTPTYSVNVNNSFAGDASGAGNYAQGEVVTIDAGTRSGYTFIGWTSTSNGVIFANVNSARTTFTMPANDVTIAAKWVYNYIGGGGSSGGGGGTPPELTNPFVDVFEKDWFYDDVLYVYKNGIMTGTSTSPMMFSPNENLTRAMIVTILYRIAGEPSVTGQTNPFTDVPAGQWYTNAVIWAANNKVVEGYGDGRFGPNDDITREQLATILDRYAAFAKITLPDERAYPGFSDDAKIAEYAKASVQRLYKSGLINGKPNNLFDPQGNATRAEAAKLFHTFLER